jgi:hypothetical protein
MNNTNYEERNYNTQTAGGSPAEGGPKEGGVAGTVILSILSFLLPIFGLILFLVYRKTKRIRAKATGICAIAGFVIFFILYMTVLQPMLAMLAYMQ